MEILRDRIVQKFPSMQVELLTRSSRGDALANIPLQQVEGTDFFTREIYESLSTGEADLAVHSLKDMSSEHFFGANRFAVPDREDPRDVLFYNPGFRQKLESGNPVIIGTCSPRREQMATEFLQSVFAKSFTDVKIELKTIRGNVDTRLRKLSLGEYDAIILAAAGVNRLLSSAETAALLMPSISQLKMIFLPLVECAPAPCQGAIVAEALPDNDAALEVLNAINEPLLFDTCVKEKELASRFGRGCDQRFGVLSWSTGGQTFLYAGGMDSDGKRIDHWYGLPKGLPGSNTIFSSTDYMGDFFSYEYLHADQLPEAPVVFVSNHKALHSAQLIEWLKGRRVWAAGTRTWKELAAKGIWVEGSADALGLESLTGFWNTALAAIDRKEVLVLTHEEAASEWQEKGYQALASYRLIPARQSAMEKAIAEADFLFWTSASQYRLYVDVVKDNAVHACPSGDTARQLKAAGLNPVVFPTIKSFQQWRTDYTR